jgi:hypothetical protein
VCDELGMPDDALRWAERSVERAALIGADREHVFSMLHLAMLLIDSLQLDDAEALLARLAEPLDRLASDEARYTFLARAAELALARRRFDAALEVADRGLAMESVPARDRAAMVMLRAHALLGLRRFEDAYGAARSARSVAVRLHADADAEEALAAAAAALRGLGRTGHEREELRALDAPSTFAAALERLLDADEAPERAARRLEAEGLARNARLMAELDARA